MGSDEDLVKRVKVADCFFNRFLCTYLLRDDFPALIEYRCVDKTTGEFTHQEKETIKKVKFEFGSGFLYECGTCTGNRSATELQYVSTLSSTLSRAATGVPLERIEAFENRKPYIPKVSHEYQTLKEEAENFITEIIQKFKPNYEYTLPPETEI